MKEREKQGVGIRDHGEQRQRRLGREQGVGRGRRRARVEKCPFFVIRKVQWLFTVQI